MSTGFRGPLTYSRPGHPMHGLPLDLIQASALREYAYVVVGAGHPWTGPAAAGTANGWVLTDEAGTSTLAMNNAGQLVLTSSTTDEDAHGLQYTTPLPFRYSTTRDIYCFARLKVSTAATTDAVFGLFGIDTDIIAASAIAVDDGIGFFKAATATDLTAHVRKNTTSTTQATGITIANDTFFVCGFTVIDGVPRVYAASDSDNRFVTADTLFGSGTAMAVTNVPDDIDIVPTFLVGQEGGTTARVLTIDWAFFAQQL